MFSQEKKGFTLIELLVVISIIGLLSSIILATLNQAREKGRIAAGEKFSTHTYRGFAAEAVGLWNFEEGTGSITRNAVDNQASTVSGATWTQGKSGYALQFDGSNDDQVIFPASIAPLPKFTLSAWVFNETGGDASHSILRAFWEIQGTRLCYWSYDFANTYWRCSPTNSVPTGKWVHVATSWNGSVISHYIDGQLKWTDTAASSGTSQVFTSIAGYPGRKFKGKIDQVHIYTESLTSAQIEQIYVQNVSKYIAVKE